MRKLKMWELRLILFVVLLLSLSGFGAFISIAGFIPLFVAVPLFAVIIGFVATSAIFLLYSLTDM